MSTIPDAPAALSRDRQVSLLLRELPFVAVLLPGVQRVLTASATGLTLLMLLALGTFTAGIHLSLRICGLALVMALAVPAIAWLQQSALFLLLAAVAILAVVGAIGWLRRDDRPVAAR